VIVLLGRRHAALVFRHLRAGHGLSRRDIAARLFVSPKTVANRERCELGMSTDVLLDMAHVFGFDVALMPKRHPGVRPTGTGWPEVTG
jgi:transcriptional regulator with XRE-family HTH domain